MIDYRAEAEAFAEFLLSLPKTRKRVGDTIRGRCPRPEHEDKNPSFSFHIAKGAWACSCGSGKGTELMAQLGWVWEGRRREQYYRPTKQIVRKPDEQTTQKQDEQTVRRTDYKILDTSGNLVATHVRFDKPDGTKSFSWEVNGQPGLNGIPTRDLPLYGIYDALQSSDPLVFLCEGEKAADAIRNRGLLAVATVCGAQSQPSPQVLSALQGKHVVLWPDADEPGRQHMNLISEKLTALGIKWEKLVWPEGRDGDDAYDYFARGGTIDGLSALIKGPPTFEEITGTKAVPLNELVHLIDQEIQYAIRPICPMSALTMIQGMPKGGKSTFSLWLSLCAALGSWPSQVFSIEKPLRVLFVEYEDRPILIVKRAAKYLAGAGLPPRALPDNLFLCDNPTLWLDTEKYERALKEEIVAKKYDLVVIDTLSYVHQAENENDAAEMKRLTAALKRIVSETGCNITFLHHVGKGSKEKAVSEAARGSSVIPAAADVILHWGDRGNTDITPVSITSKYDDGFRCSVEYVRTPDGIVWRVQKEVDETPRGEDAVEAVFRAAQELLVSSPEGIRSSTLTKVTEELGLARRTAIRHVGKLVSDGKLVRKPDGKGGFIYVMGDASA